MRTVRSRWPACKLQQKLHQTLRWWTITVGWANPWCPSRPRETLPPEAGPVSPLGRHQETPQEIAKQSGTSRAAWEHVAKPDCGRLRLGDTNPSTSISGLSRALHEPKPGSYLLPRHRVSKHPVRHSDPSRTSAAAERVYRCGRANTCVVNRGGSATASQAAVAARPATPWGPPNATHPSSAVELPRSAWCIRLVESSVQLQRRSSGPFRSLFRQSERRSASFKIDRKMVATNHVRGKTTICQISVKMRRFPDPESLSHLLLSDLLLPQKPLRNSSRSGRSAHIRG